MCIYTHRESETERVREREGEREREEKREGGREGERERFIIKNWLHDDEG